MIEATIALAALIPLAGFVGWRIRLATGAQRANADDYRNRAERAEAALAEALAELAKYKLPRNAKGQFVGRAK